jgi:hypothetical protein
VKPGNIDPDDIKKENPDPDSTIERRNVLKSGLATTVVFAGGAVLSAISCLQRVLSSSDDSSESS